MVSKSKQEVRPECVCVWGMPPPFINTQHIERGFAGQRSNGSFCQKCGQFGGPNFTEEWNLEESHLVLKRFLREEVDTGCLFPHHHHHQKKSL